MDIPVKEKIEKRIRELEGLPDYGKRRWVAKFGSFDLRANSLNAKCPTQGGEKSIDGHIKMLDQTKMGLVFQYGQQDALNKIERFSEVGVIPLSVVAQHSEFLRQIRDAYVVGAYYAALTGACALGERILNHIMLDLRNDFKYPDDYPSGVKPKVKSQKSFDDWDLCIKVISHWGIFWGGVEENFSKLKTIRHRSIHFNQETYDNVKDDSLAAARLILKIVEIQFGTFGDYPWVIPGTAGQVFLKRDWEDRPFIRCYFLPYFDCVGFLFTFKPPDNGSIDFRPVDFPDYGKGVLSDEEFAEAFTNRSPEETATWDKYEKEVGEEK